MSLINIDLYTKPKENSGSGSGLSNRIQITNIKSATWADKLTHTSNIYGNKFDGTQDIENDFLVKSPIDSSSFVQFIPTEYADENSRLILNKTDLRLKNSSLELGEDSIITADKIECNTLYATVLDSKSSSIIVNKPLKLMEGLDLSGQDLKIKDLDSQNIVNHEMIKTKDLLVSGNAHFFNLVIDEVKHAGGQLLLSPGSFRVDDIDENLYTYTIGTDCVSHRMFGGGNESSYICKRLYMKSSDDTDTVINNTVQVNDHLFCYVANVGNKANMKNYWSAVLAAGEDVKRVINGTEVLCNYVDLVIKCVNNGEYNPDYAEVNVEKGDNLGVLGSLNEDRQSAIMFCSYACPDIEVEAPCWIQYQNIDGWSFTGKKSTYFAKNKNRIQGELVAQNGNTLDGVLEQIQDGVKTYVHTAWANSADGSQDFTKNAKYINNPKYQGFCSTLYPYDDYLTYSDYIWSPVTDSGKLIKDKLIPIRERLYFEGGDRTVWIDLHYSATNWSSQDNYIKCEVRSTDGHNITLDVNRVIKNISETLIESVYLTANIQQWDNVEAGDRFNNARVYLYNGNDEVLDERMIQISMDPTSVLEITDKIAMRVNDSEGNISSLIIESDRIRQEVSNITFDADSITERIGSLEVTAESITGKVEKLTQDVDGVTREMSQIKQTVDEIDLSVIDEFEGNLEKTGINIQQGTITLDADNTIITGDLKIKGFIYQEFRPISLSDAEFITDSSTFDGFSHDVYKLGTQICVDSTQCGVILPMDANYEGARVVLLDSWFIKSRTAKAATTVQAENGSMIASGYFANKDVQAIKSNYHANMVMFDSGTLEFTLQNVPEMDSSGNITESHLQWILINNACGTMRYKLGNNWYDYKYNLANDL